MSITRAWSPDTPADADPRKWAAREIRYLKQDIHERLEESLVVDMDDGVNPLVLKPEVSGLVASKTLFMHNSVFQPGSTWIAVGSHQDLTYLDRRFVAPNYMIVAADHEFYAPLILPVGVTLLGYNLMVDTTAAAAFTTTLSLHKATYGSATPTDTTIATLVATGAAASLLHILDAALAEEIIASRYYYFKLVSNISASHKIYGMSVTYSTPSHMNTI